ncbi:MAG TPA: EthD family reductase [Aldersonia sp.]
MSYRVAVLYGTPTDPAAFDEHYANTHVPLAAAVPGLAGFEWGKCAGMGKADPPYYLAASLIFPTEEAMKSGLRSPEMQAAGADVANFATGGVTMFVVGEQSGLSD